MMLASRIQLSPRGGMRSAKVRELLGMSPATLTRFVANVRGFPQPYRLGPKTLVFSADAIKKWFENQQSGGLQPIPCNHGTKASASQYKCEGSNVVGQAVRPVTELANVTEAGDEI